MPKSLSARVSLLILLLTLMACGGMFEDNNTTHFDPPASRNVTIQYVNSSGSDVHMVYGTSGSLDQSTRVNASQSRTEQRTLNWFSSQSPSTFTFTVASPSMNPQQGSITLNAFQVQDGSTLRVEWNGSSVLVTQPQG